MIGEEEQKRIRAKRNSDMILLRYGSV